MGKIKHKKRMADAAVSPTGLTSVKEAEKEAALSPNVTADIQHVIEKLNSTTAAERDYACTALGMYLSETKTLQYVLEKDTVRTIGCLLQDEKPQVVLAATGLLKSISEEGGFDSCEVMIKQGVITFATNLIKKAHKMWSESSLKEDFLLHSVINSITMLQNLCETSNLGITICLEEGVVPVLLEFIKFENKQLLQTTIEYLYTVSEENELVISLLNQSEHLNQFNKIIMQKKDDTSYTLIRITTIGIISNITEISSIREGVIPSILLTTLQINTHEKLQSVSTSCHNKKQSNGAELSGGEAGLNGEEETMDQDEQQMEVNEEKKKEKKSNTPLQDANENFTELSNIILSQKLTFEILSNVITTADSDVGDWCDIDDDSASESGSINSIEHDEMMNDDQDGGLLSPLFSLLVKEDIILLICRRIQFINDELYKVLKRSDKSIQEQIKHAINQYSKMLSSALFCFNNILQHVNVEQLGGLPAVTKLFTQLVITCSQQHVSESDVLQESVLHAARALVEVIKNNNSESLAVSSVLIEKIKEMTLVKDLDTAVNAVKILALLAQLNNTPADIVQLVSEWYMELMKTRNELWLIAETLDSIIDIFSEDDYDHVIRKVELITFLQAAQPVFTKLVRSRDKSDKTHNAVINTVKSNLPRFIKYKINSLRNL